MSEPLVVTGDGRARGLAQGEHLREAIHEVLERVIDSMGGPAQVEAFLENTRFREAIATHTPDLLAEFDGIAAGAGVPTNHLLAHNLMDEHWWWSETQGNREACSTLATPGPPALVGQTMDLDRLLDGSQRAITHSTTGSSVTVLTSAGLVGLCGASSAGFGLCVNALTTLEHSGSGLPVAFVIRGALAQPNADAAAEFIRSVPHASGQHYAIVGRGRSGNTVTSSVECSAFGTIASAEPGSRFGHANHPLATADVDPAMIPAESRSELRQSVLDVAGSEVTTADDLAELLSVSPLCLTRRDDHEWFTFGAIVVEINDVVTMRYTLGPPDAEQWHSTVVEISLR
ncbi:MAG: C45 family autoproteolytic acyltransferase/hydrolase [Actinobacteria bacterium]|nr:C45 family autoproteolytic acyltransferase/hydrolase [Actinomycetota bacterium]